MEGEIYKYNMIFLPVSVTRQDGSPDRGAFARGYLVQYAGEGEGPDIHPAAGTSMNHGSPLKNGPLFLYETPESLDQALFAFTKERGVPIYYVDPTGHLEHVHGQKLAHNWPSRCAVTITLLLPTR